MGMDELFCPVCGSAHCPTLRGRGTDTHPEFADPDCDPGTATDYQSTIDQIPKYVKVQTTTKRPLPKYVRVQATTVDGVTVTHEELTDARETLKSLLLCNRDFCRTHLHIDRTLTVQEVRDVFRGVRPVKLLCK